MHKTLSAFLLTGAVALTLAACDTLPPQNVELANAHFWQRAETSSAIYQRGPKAQQMLHRDIAECTHEVRELKRLGIVRGATPADANSSGAIPDQNTPQGRLDSWDTPTREGYLLTEHTDFHDFETCMMTKGWERVEYLPHDLAETARDNYVQAITGERRRTESGERQRDSVERGPYDSLNQ